MKYADFMGLAKSSQYIKNYSPLGYLFGSRRAEDNEDKMVTFSYGEVPSSDKLLGSYVLTAYDSRIHDAECLSVYFFAQVSDLINFLVEYIIRVQSNCDYKFYIDDLCRKRLSPLPDVIEFVLKEKKSLSPLQAMLLQHDSPESQN